MTFKKAPAKQQPTAKKKPGRPKKTEPTYLYDWDSIFKDWHPIVKYSIGSLIKHTKMRTFRKNPEVYVCLGVTVHDEPNLQWLEKIDKEAEEDLERYIASRCEPVRLAKQQAINEKLEPLKVK
jgi:hypothetical protein